MHLRIKTTSFLNRLNNLRSELNQHSVSIYIYIFIKIMETYLQIIVFLF